jgi:acyl-CoA synthetase (NDP forming)
MLQADLGELLTPKSIAVIGAGPKPGHGGGRIVAAARAGGRAAVAGAPVRVRKGQMTVVDVSIAAEKSR